MKNEYVEYLKKYLDKDKIDDGLKKLEMGIAPQYVVGNVNFYGNIINVDNRVLIPRFETELLVEKTIMYINKYFDKKVDILDIGTGSGCIAISLAKNVNCSVVGCDISSDALEVAKENAKNNNCNINFVNSDIFSNIDSKFDVIISNPPYIGYDEEIDEIVRNNEPSIALFAENDGLYYYDKILKNCKKYLNDKFLIAFEIGINQGSKVRNLVDKYFDDVCVDILKDYSNRDRYVFIYRV